jgi:hypothetical protein
MAFSERRGGRRNHANRRKRPAKADGETSSFISAWRRRAAASIHFDGSKISDGS